MKKVLSVLFMTAFLGLSAQTTYAEVQVDNSSGYASRASSIADVACQHALKSRENAAVRKQRQQKDVYLRTLGKKVERVAKNCIEAIGRSSLPYVNFNPASIIDAIINKANQACLQAAGKVQSAQARALSEFTGTLPYGLGGAGRTTIKIGSGSSSYDPVRINGRSITAED